MIDEMPADEVCGEDTSLLHIAQTVFAAAGGKHDELWPVRDRVEEGIGRQIDEAIRALRSDPADRPRCDNRLEGIMGQAVLVGIRGVEHHTSPTQVTTSARSGRGRSTGGNTVEPIWM